MVNVYFGFWAQNFGQRASTRDGKFAPSCGHSGMTCDLSSQILICHVRIPISIVENMRPEHSRTTPTFHRRGQHCPLLGAPYERSDVIQGHPRVTLFRFHPRASPSFQIQSGLPRVFISSPCALIQGRPRVFKFSLGFPERLDPRLGNAH